MRHGFVLKQLAVNAMFWTGILAVLFTVFEGNYYFSLFFAGLVVLNFAIILLVEKVWPNAVRIMDEVESNGLVFKMKPIKYPKVLDNEKREYLPEFIHLDILSNQKTVFAGDLARNVLKQLRDSLDQVLSTELVQLKATTLQKPAVKKNKEKKAELKQAVA